MKADAFKGKRKIKDRWEEDTWEVVHQIATDIPSYKVTDQCGRSCILHQNQLLLIASEVGIPLCIGVFYAWDRCTSPTQHKPTSMGDEIEMTPQENIGSAVTQCPASKTSLGWINRKLWLLPWTSTGTSTEDGWRPQVSVTWLLMSRGTHAFCWGNDVAAHRCHQIVNLETNATTHGTGSWLARPNMAGVMGKYPSVSGRGMSRCLPCWCGILPSIWRETLAMSRGLASYPHSTRNNDNHKNQSWQQPNSNHPTAWAWGHAHWRKRGVNVGSPPKYELQ